VDSNILIDDRMGDSSTDTDMSDGERKRKELKAVADMKRAQARRRTNAVPKSGRRFCSL